MDNSRKLTVSYGSFACVLEGFEAPFPLMREIVSHFQDLSGSDPGFGRSDEIADFDALKRRLAEETGAEIDLEPIAGGVYVRRIELPQADAPGPEDAEEAVATAPPAFAPQATMPEAEPEFEAPSPAGEAEAGAESAAADAEEPGATAEDATTEADSHDEPDDLAVEATEADGAPEDIVASEEELEAELPAQDAPSELADEVIAADEGASDKIAAEDVAADETASTPDDAEPEAAPPPLELVSAAAEDAEVAETESPEATDADADAAAPEDQDADAPAPAEDDRTGLAAGAGAFGNGAAPEEDAGSDDDDDTDEGEADLGIAAALADEPDAPVQGEPAAKPLAALRLGPEMAAPSAEPEAPPAPGFIDTIAGEGTEDPMVLQPAAAAAPDGVGDAGGKSAHRGRGPLSIFRRKSDREEPEAEPDSFDDAPALKPDIAAIAAAPFDLQPGAADAAPAAGTGKGLLRVVGDESGAGAASEADQTAGAALDLGRVLDPEPMQPAEPEAAPAPAAEAEDEPLPVAEEEPGEGTAAASGKPKSAAAEQFDNRLHASFTSSEPEMTAGALEISVGADGEEDAMTPGGFARRAKAETLPDLMAASGAYLMLADHREGFTRGEIMNIIQDLAGEKQITAEAKVKAFGKLVRGGQFVRGDAGQFALSGTELERHAGMSGDAGG